MSHPRVMHARKYFSEIIIQKGSRQENAFEDV